MSQVKQGMVRIRDSKILTGSEFLQNGCNIGVTPGRVVRLELTGSVLKIQKETDDSDQSENHMYNDVVTPKDRNVLLTRQKVGGLGLSIKGGYENKLPILISRIFKDQAADQTGQLFVGDAIVKVNNASLDQCNHDDAVNILRAAGEHVQLVVRHYKPATPFLNKNSIVKAKDRPSSSEESSINCMSEDDGWQNVRNSKESDQSWKNVAKRTESKWTDMVFLNLMLAYITRYIPGTDKRRPNGFEVWSSADNISSGVIQCEDSTALTDWVKHVSNNITQLTGQQIVAWNKDLDSHDQIIDMCWVSERTTSHQPWHRWKRKFIAIRGSSFYVFDSPPTSLTNWCRCTLVVKVHQAMFRTLKDTEHVDDRRHCFLLQTSLTSSIYLSAETRAELMRIESAWHKATYATITSLASKTFPVVVKSKAAGLTLDWTMGFGLYDTNEKCYVWKYKFSQLKGSSDDSKTKLRLHFHDSGTNSVETKEVECQCLQSLLYCMHAFLTAKVVSVDPNFLKTT